MVGTTKDPANGKEVAASVFIAVIVYAVCPHKLIRREFLPLQMGLSI